MRALFLLHGAPASGKTTLINQLGVADLTLGYDLFRSLFSTAFPCADDDGSLGESVRLPSEVGNQAVAAAKQALTARLSAGTTVFFDSTMMRISDQSEMAKLAHRYGYRTYLIDCQGDLSLDELLERNRQRSAKRIDENALHDIYAHCAEKPVSPFITEIIDGTAGAVHVERQIARITAVPELVTDSKVIVVGDVQSCAEALQEAIEAHDDGQTQWVFVGDLFDRGPDPVGVWNIVTDLIEQGRGTVVTGNHELNLRAVNTQTAHNPLSDTRRTRNLLLEAGILAGEQNRLVNDSVPVLRVQTEGHIWIVTHGGVGDLTLAKLDEGLLDVSDAECIYGMGDRGHTYLGKTNYDVASIPLAGGQLHGHRNGRVGDEPVETVRQGSNGGPVVCLESGVSAGGKLTLAVIEADREPDIHRFDDRVSPEMAKANSMTPWDRKKAQAADVEDIDELLAQMYASEHINVREVEGLNNVVACNFTRKVFREGAWTDLTMHARGLFIDEAAGTIVARGYEKFFHIGEEPGRDLETWLNANRTAYPVSLHKKYNGYLALAACIDDELVVFSKAGITPYSEFAKSLLIKQIGADGAEKLAQMLKRTKTTAAFEVIVANDTHPITEPGPDRLVLLDCINNTVAFSTNEKIRTGIARRFDFEVADDERLAGTPEVLQVVLEQSAHRHDEGIVLVDARGYRSKVKADGYAERKAARTALERFWSGKTESLGQRFADLESDLARTGIAYRIKAGDYTVVGVDGKTRLDLARIFDDLETRR